MHRAVPYGTCMEDVNRAGANTRLVLQVLTEDFIIGFPSHCYVQWRICSASALTIVY